MDEGGRPLVGGKEERLVAGRNREVQVRRTGARKLFDDERKRLFLEWFGATCNLSLAAEQAEINYKTVSKHYLKDPGFAAECDEAVRLGVMRLKAKSLETRAAAPTIGVEGDLDAPALDDISREEAMRLVREHERSLLLGRKPGRAPRAASNEELFHSLVKRLVAFGARVAEEDRIAALHYRDGPGAARDGDGRSA